MSANAIKGPIADHKSIRRAHRRRKLAGVNSGSPLHFQDDARERGVYAAMVEGTKGHLYLRVGGNDDTWQPSAPTRLYAQGEGWTVWISLPNNPPIQQALLPTPLDAPLKKTLLTREDIPDAWIKEN